MLKLFMLTPSFLRFSPCFFYYTKAIVAASTEAEAKMFHPAGYIWDESFGLWGNENKQFFSSSTWVNPKNVLVEYIGIAKKGTDAGVLLASCNNGR